jgi:hypothetical protein
MNEAAIDLVCWQPDKASTSTNKRYMCTHVCEHEAIQNRIMLDEKSTTCQRVSEPWLHYQEMIYMLKLEPMHACSNTHNSTYKKVPARSEP